MPPEVMRRQLPRGEPEWGDFHFDFFGGTTSPDFWVVLNDIGRPTTCECARSRTVLVCAEPSAVHGYHPRFISRFGAVLSCQAGMRHPRLLLGQPGLLWWAGVEMMADGKCRVRFDYEDFRKMAFGPKDDRISVINSGKALVPGHRERNHFLAVLKAHFRDRLEVFGRGSRPVADKLEAISPFKYHIAIENSVEPHYWSEKLADAFLGGAMPFYSGCPDIENYFPAGSLCRIDLRDPAGAINLIEQTLASDGFARSADARNEARGRVLNEHNTFALLARILPTFPDGPRRTITVRPHSDLAKPFHGRLKRRARRALERIAPGLLR